ncbi:MAG: hydrogenase maturation protease [Phycisphaerae bacterium]|nr:hydrogenase maturation protease [Phycisphaerae bacterium]
MRRPVVVLGLGNPLMGDEGVGVAIVQDLMRAAAEYPWVDFVDAGTGGLAILHQIEGRAKAILVDAAFMGESPGAIRRFTPDQVATVKPLSGLSLHEADVVKVVHMARALGQCPGTVVFFGIEPQEIAPGTAFSEPIRQGWPEYKRQISAEWIPNEGETMASIKILIVDDDPDITEAMRVVLENRGYQVDSAADSVKAMKRIAAQRPDLIILDVMMTTSQEGFTLSRKLKQDPATQTIPILMLTAVKEKTGIDFKPETGDESWLPVDGFLDKPVRPDVLVQKVEGLLRKA